MKKNRLLIIDSNNQFMRYFIVNPSLSNNGNPCGAIIGFLQGLQKFINEINPDYVVTIWDGAGGSARRKQKDKNYKSGRTVPKLNWDSSYLGGQEGVIQNQMYQIVSLHELLELLPVNNIVSESVEADDIISYVCQMSYFQDWQKVIISSDKDFIQLLNSETILVRPTQKEILTVKKVIEEFNIHPNNFLLARSICGDKSDNLQGVDGAGLPTVAKRFPILLEEKQYLIEDIVKACEKEIEHKTKIKLYKNVLDNRGKIEDNYNMMQLCIPKIPVGEALKIQEQIKNKKLIFQKTEFIRMMSKIGFSISLESFTQNMNKLCFNKV